MAVRKQTVLVIGSSPDETGLKYLESVLDQFPVVEVTPRSEAIQRAQAILRTGKLDLVIIVMSRDENHVAGCQVLTEFRLIPELAGIPIIFQTNDGEDEEELCEDCDQAGNDEDDPMETALAPPPKPS